MTDDERVVAITGKTFAQWFDELDAQGLAGRGPRAVAAAIQREFRVPGVWAEAIAGSYERMLFARSGAELRAAVDGVRPVHQAVSYPAGFAWGRITAAAAARTWLGVSKLVVLALGDEYALEDGATVRLDTMRPPHLLRFAWQGADDGEAGLLEVELRSESPTVTTVEVRHEGGIEAGQTVLGALVAAIES